VGWVGCSVPPAFWLALASLCRLFVYSTGQHQQQQQQQLDSITVDRRKLSIEECQCVWNFVTCVTLLNVLSVLCVSSHGKRFELWTFGTLHIGARCVYCAVFMDIDLHSFLSHLPLNHRAIAMCITFVHCWLAFCHAANKRRFDWALPNMCWCAAKKLLTRTVAQPNQTSWLPNVVDLQLRSWVWTRFPCAYWLLIDNVSSNKPLLTVLLRQYSIIGDEIDNLHISSLSTLLVPLL